MKFGKVIYFTLIFSANALAAVELCKSPREAIEQGCVKSIQPNAICLEDKIPVISESCFTMRADKKSLKLKESSKKAINEMAERLVYRMYRDMEMPALSESDFDSNEKQLWHGIQIQLGFSDQIIEHVIQEGFLNQHQTHTTNGYLDSKLRNKLESALINFKLSAQDKQHAYILPKYAAASPVYPQEFLPAYKWANYGNMLAVLKSNVKNRVTITAADSLDLFYGRKKFMEKARTLRTFLKDDKFIDSRRYSGTKQYMEAQIWGMVGLEDVDYFIVNCIANIPYSRLALVYELTKIPMYSCKIESHEEKDMILSKNQILFGP